MSLIETAKEILTDLSDALRGAGKVEAELERRHRDDVAKHAKLRETLLAGFRERDQIRNALAPDVELHANVARIVDAYAEVYLRDHGSGLLRHLSGQISSQELNGRTVTTMGQPNLPVGPNEAVPLGLQCALDPEGMTAKWVALIRRIPHEGGIPMAERPARLAELDSELAALEQKEDQVAKMLNVPRRREMVQRENAAASAAELAEQKRKDTEWLEEQKASGRLGTPQVRTAHMHPDRRG